MTSEIAPAKTIRVRASSKSRDDAGSARQSLWLTGFDAALLATFLALTFLLGMFPLKDTDFWWHLRTGDLIRQSGTIPRTDTYTFTVSGQPWIDLHWLFEVAVSWVFANGGVPALTLAKCGVTVLAVSLLVTSGRRDWPLWATLIAWLPALIVLGGRMYVRPETLTLLYLSIYLAVLTRIDRRPLLALLLPAVQVAWVNTQGLFIFGPILLGFALIDAVARPGAFATDRKNWWRIVAAATVLTGFACLLNPYGLRGALNPLQLARTMANPLFSNSIAELTPIPLFIKRDGIESLPLRLHLFTMILGAASFLLPLCWLIAVRVRDLATRPNGGAESTPKVESASGKARRKRSKSPKSAAMPALWRLSVFRLLLFAAFSALSLQATRNSHQFAGVVGAVTAWNFAEWAAAIHRRASERGTTRPGSTVLPRVVAIATIFAVLGLVASGRFYAMAKEGRAIGLGEQPLWYPHDAVKFAGGPGMPQRFLGFHIGHASLYEYYFAPERKVYADARLELMGVDLFERYLELQRRLTDDDPSWPRELDEMGRPAVLVDLEGNAAVGATLLTSPKARDWHCVWLDPVAAVFVHSAFDQVVATHGVDVAVRHFHPRAEHEPNGPDALLASAKGLRNLVSFAGRNGPKRTRPIVVLGMDHARRLVQIDPDDTEAWKLIGQFEVLREATPREPVPRFRLPFDPIFDLSSVRATYALRRVLESSPDDFLALLMLEQSFESRAMTEAALPLNDHLVTLTPLNGRQAESQNRAEATRTALRSALGPSPPASWDNLSQLGQIINGLLAGGRAETAADYLERAWPAESRGWDETDRIATLRLHLGQPDRARAIWRQSATPKNPALRDTRVAITYLVEGDFEAARQRLRAVLADDPSIFEAHYILAELEQDAGRASESLAAARKARSLAPNDFARYAAGQIVEFVTPYAMPPIASE